MKMIRQTNPVGDKNINSQYLCSYWRYLSLNFFENTHKIINRAQNNASKKLDMKKYNRC